MGRYCNIPLGKGPVLQRRPLAAGVMAKGQGSEARFPGHFCCYGAGAHVCLLHPSETQLGRILALSAATGLGSLQEWMAAGCLHTKSHEHTCCSSWS
jgi:hypothetical protein